MTSRFQLGRTVTIATCVGVFFLGLAVFFFFLSWVSHAYFWHRARFGCLMAISVDFSTPGTYTASIEYDQPIHNGFLGLDVPDRALSEKSPDVLVSGLQGTFAIVDENGMQITGGPLVGDPNEIRLRYFQNIIELRELFDWYGKVKWKINTDVTQGAANLKGIPQHLVLINSEPAVRFRIPHFLYTFISWGALLAGIIIMTIVTVISLGKSKRLENNKM